RFRWARFDAPELTQRVRPVAAITQARALLQDARSVVFTGPAGSGKTSLARALWFALAMDKLPRVADRHGARYTDVQNGAFGGSAVYVQSFDLAKARREAALGRGEAELIRQCERADVLLVDEIGSEADKGDTALAELIHERHNAARRSIFVTP